VAVYVEERLVASAVARSGRYSPAAQAASREALEILLEAQR
jgi:hypothetical protein